MGFKGFDYPDYNTIYKEHAALTEGTNIDISGLDYNIIQRKKTVNGHTRKSTKAEVLQDCLPTRNFIPHPQKAIIHTVPDTITSEKPNADFPLILTTGRIRDQWHTMSKTGKVNKLKQHIPSAFLEIHPDDARRLEHYR